MNRPYKRMMVIFIPLSVVVTLMAIFGQPTYNPDLLKQLWIFTIIMTLGCIWGEWIQPLIELKGEHSVLINLWSLLWQGIGLIAVFGFGLIGLTVLYLSILTLE